MAVPSTRPQSHQQHETDGDGGMVELLPVHDFMLMFCGAKSETPTSEIQIKQSQTDRRVKNEVINFN